MGLVEIVRGGVVESRHEVHVVVTRADGHIVAGTGDPTGLTYYRSAAKPIQALPLVEEGVADRFGFTTEELALCCASHEGEAAHVAGARSILSKAGVGEDLLRCGPHLPFSPVASRAVTESGGVALRIHNNCSGKHAGMLALAVGMGWDPHDYHEAAHPVQKRMRSEVQRWTGLSADEIPSGVDGCGVLCFAVPLNIMAQSMAGFAAAAGDGQPAARVVSAMTGHPFMVGGTGRTCTDVMARASGRAFVKLGAEGVYAGGVPDRGLGFAIKVLDGGRRAVEVALVQTLADLGIFDEADVSALSQHAHPDVLNTRGEVVGEVRSAFSLEGEAA
jgi:L-asparaginase II